MKPTTYFYSVILQCQMHQNFVFYVFYCNLKEKDHIRRITNSKKKKSFDLSKIRAGRALTIKNYVVAFAFLLYK